MAGSVRARRRSDFDPRFVERHALLWPLARAASAFAQATRWPEVTAWRSAFAAAAPVQFVAEPPRPRRERRRRRPLDERELYDARIVESREVPSRPRHWHDFLNAMVWATFPRAKAALHARQHAATRRRLAPHATRLPEHRTRELDALAMIDEGGVIELRAASARAFLVFGHAIYEGLALGGPPMTARVVVAEVGALADPIAQADERLSALLARPHALASPDELPRIDVPDAAPPAWLPARPRSARL